MSENGSKSCCVCVFQWRTWLNVLFCPHFKDIHFHSHRGWKKQENIHITFVFVHLISVASHKLHCICRTTGAHGRTPHAIYARALRSGLINTCTSQSTNRPCAHTVHYLTVAVMSRQNESASLGINMSSVKIYNWQFHLQLKASPIAFFTPSLQLMQACSTRSRKHSPAHMHAQLRIIMHTQWWGG